MSEPAPNARVAISVRPDRGFLNIRLNPRNSQALKAAERILGHPLPLAAKHIHARRAHYLLAGARRVADRSRRKARRRSRPRAYRCPHRVPRRDQRRERRATSSCSSAARTRAGCWRRAAPWTCIRGSSRRGNARRPAWAGPPSCWPPTMTGRPSPSSFAAASPITCAAGLRTPHARTAPVSPCDSSAGSPERASRPLLHGKPAIFACVGARRFREYVSHWAPMTRRSEWNQAPWMGSCVSRKGRALTQARQPHFPLFLAREHRVTSRENSRRGQFRKAKYFFGDRAGAFFHDGAGYVLAFHEAGAGNVGGRLARAVLEHCTGWRPPAFRAERLESAARTRR